MTTNLHSIKSHRCQTFIYNDFVRREREDIMNKKNNLGGLKFKCMGIRGRER